MHVEFYAYDINGIPHLLHTSPEPEYIQYFIYLVCLPRLGNQGIFTSNGIDICLHISFKFIHQSTDISRFNVQCKQMDLTKEAATSGFQPDWL